MSQLSGVTLAYMGDAIYEVLVREMLLKQGIQKVDNLHKKAIKYTSAVGQNIAVGLIKESLTEEEMGIFKRGRNANGDRKARHASIAEYRQATGLEALFGFLYLDKRFDRIYELLNIIIKES
jgi:ribonuclease-3 family protein